MNTPKLLTIVVVLLSFWLVYAIIKSNAIESNCIRDNKRNCGWGQIKVPPPATSNNTPLEIVQKLLTLEMLQKRLLCWRNAMLVAVTTTIFFWGLIINRWPTGVEYILSVLLMFMIGYWCCNFSNFHYVDFIHRDREIALNILKDKINGQ